MRKPSERLMKKVHKENLWFFILKLIEKKEMYGNEIRQMINNMFGFWCGNVTAYKVLYLLESGGYVKSQKKNGKVYYKATGKGINELRISEAFLKSLIKAKLH